MYLSWEQKTITEFSDENINAIYSQGYVFTRLRKGVTNQTRSLRIDLSKFKLSSENRRILRKTENLRLETRDLPLGDYSWKIGKMAKDFYDTKFGKGTFSANKVKELLTTEESNFNRLLVYSLLLRGERNERRSNPMNEAGDKGIPTSPEAPRNDSNAIGYCITHETNELLHYSYPFYHLSLTTNHIMPNVGLGMMLKSILWAKEQNKTYFYLGSYQRPGDKYKLQFKGLEWFDGERWNDDLEKLKSTLPS